MLKLLLRWILLGSINEDLALTPVEVDFDE